MLESQYARQGHLLRGRVGLDGALVDVEVDISNGQPGFTIVGLPDAAVQESRERGARIVQRVRERSVIRNAQIAPQPPDDSLRHFAVCFFRLQL